MLGDSMKGAELDHNIWPCSGVGTKESNKANFIMCERPSACQ